DTGETGADTGETGADTGEPPEPLDVEASVHEVMASIIVLTWTQEEPATVQAEYSFDEGIWLATPAYGIGPAEARLLLLGIPFDTSVTWRVLVDGRVATEDAVIRTGDAPGGLPDIDHVEGDPEAWDPTTRWILGSLAPGSGSPSGARPWTFLFDRQGRMVWAHRTPTNRTTFSPKLSTNGTEILIDDNSWWGAFDGGAASQVARLDIEGTTLGTYATPGLIHPFTQTGDGFIAWAAAQGGTSYAGEVLAVLDPSGRTTKLFDCNAFSRNHGGASCGANTALWTSAP
ncbi:MAG: hypothetical protein JXB39_10905, partial [Deltaproteobacteria bacterium]|nr:hypothetical protein [Deltaproteobacteria bacterium]